MTFNEKLTIFLMDELNIDKDRPIKGSFERLQEYSRTLENAELTKIVDKCDKEILINNDYYFKKGMEIGIKMGNGTLINE